MNRRRAIAFLAGWLALVPVVAMALSTLFEGYRWSLLAAAGAALVLIGLVLALKARRPNR